MESDNSAIVSAYRAQSKESAELAGLAGQLFPSGLTHDSRYLLPYGIYVERAQGSRKWDVDGNEYLDYLGSWGPLVLGHSHPAVVDVLKKTAEGGTSFGAPVEQEVELAKLICNNLPSVDSAKSQGCSFLARPKIPM